MEWFALYAATKTYADWLLPGERIVALDGELGLENIWMASNKAVYVVATASQTNKALGRSAEVERVPYECVTGFLETQQADIRERALEFEDPTTGVHRKLVSWCDTPVGENVAAVIRRHLPDGNH